MRSRFGLSCLQLARRPFALTVSMPTQAYGNAQKAIKVLNETRAKNLSKMKELGAEIATAELQAEAALRILLLEKGLHELSDLPEFFYDFVGETGTPEDVSHEQGRTDTEPWGESDTEPWGESMDESANEGRGAQPETLDTE